MPQSPLQLNDLVRRVYAALDAGRLTEAELACRQVLAIRPDVAEVYHDLGSILSRQGRLADAKAEFQRAIAIKPNLVGAHVHLARLLSDEGKLDEAVAHYNLVIALKPDFVQAYRNAGRILCYQGKFAEGATRLAQLVALTPDSADAHARLSSALVALNRLDDAVRHVERALELKPDLAEAHNHLGYILTQQGKFAEALARYQQSLALKPDYAEAHNNLANILRHHGRLDEARASFDRAIALRPDYAEALYGRAGLKSFSADDPELAELQQLVDHPGRIPEGKQHFIHFALGKALDDVGQYDRAFDQWKKGAALKRRQLKFNEPRQVEALGGLRQLVDATLIERLSGAGDPNPAPIFILGMPRSGSTLVEQILASHPAVYGAGELAILSRIAGKRTGPDGRPIHFPFYLPQIDAESLAQMGRDYLAALPALPDGKTRITDKAPGNFWYVGLIRLILPNAKIIHTTRDPVDTCISCFSRLFKVGQSFSYDLGELGRFFCRYRDVMDHWRAVLPADAMLDVAYEDVVDRLEEQARRLVEFCGLPWDDACLSFHETRRLVVTSSGVQVRRPIYRSSLGWWRRYEKHLGPLLAELKDVRLD